MNQYLLLRDNKQSGPYSVEELVAKGLKPYDLVWLEGKSAAWRYPSELEDLKPYAPAVEEQPYDRFYKKPVAEGAHEANAGAAGGNAGATVQTLVQEAVLHRVQQQHENEQRQQGYEQQQDKARATAADKTVTSGQDDTDVNAVSATVTYRQGDSAINDNSATVTSRKDDTDVNTISATVTSRHGDSAINDISATVTSRKDDAAINDMSSTVASRKDDMLETGTPTTVASTNNTFPSSDTIPTSNGSIADASANEAPIQHTISSNKIHVILPAGNHTLVVKNNEQQVKDDQKPAASVSAMSASVTATPNSENLPGNENGSIGKKEVDHGETEMNDGTIGKKIAAHVSQPVQPVAKEKFVPEEKQLETAGNNKNVFANHAHQSSQQQSNQQQPGSLSLEEAIKVVMANAKDLHAGSSGNTSASFNDTSASSNNTNAEFKNTVAATNTWEEEPAPLQEQLRIAGNRRSKPNNYKMLLRGTIAACLVLGGIIIGLVINRQPSHPTDQATLDQLVSQLQEKEKRQQANNAASLMDQPAENTDLPDNSTNTNTTSNEDVTEDPSYAAVTPMQVPSVPADKEKQLVNKPDLSGSQTVQQPEMKIVPAVVTNKKEESNNRNSPNANYARENIDKLVSVEASDFKTGVLGGISGLQLTVVNGSLFAMDQVEVQVNFLGPEKRVVKTQTIVFNDLGAGIQKTLEVPKTNRGVSINYMIKRIQSKELGIAHAGF